MPAHHWVVEHLQEGQELSGALRAALGASAVDPLASRGAVNDPRWGYALAYVALGWPCSSWGVPSGHWPTAAPAVPQGENTTRPGAGA